MFDLELFDDRGRFAAVEITAVADEKLIETTKHPHCNGGRWIDQRLTGGWSIRVRPTARVSNLRGSLGNFLQYLETAGVREVNGDSDGGPFQAQAHRLGIVTASQYPTACPGSIYPMPVLPASRSGGVVPLDGDSLAQWAGEWLFGDRQRDNLCETGQHRCA